jgi:hypothetical protein
MIQRVRAFITIEYSYSAFQLITFYEVGVTNRVDKCIGKIGWITANNAQAIVAKTSRSQ